MHGAVDLQRVQHRQRLMHAHRHRVVGAPGAAHQRKVDALARFVAERVGRECAESGLHGTRAQGFQQRFNPAAVLDQTRNAADLEPVFSRELLQVGQARHRAVVFHDLADHRRRCTTRHGREIATGLGMPGAHQHAAVHRLQREDMARLHQVVGPRAPCHGGLHRACAVGRRDAGGHAFSGLDRHGKRGSELGAIAHRHRRQLQAFA